MFLIYLIFKTERFKQYQTHIYNESIRNRLLNDPDKLSWMNYLLINLWL